MQKHQVFAATLGCVNSRLLFQVTKLIYQPKTVYSKLQHAKNNTQQAAFKTVDFTEKL